MNQGSCLIEDQSNRNELSELNRLAGEKALTSSAFQSAATYFLAGISLLGPDSWEENYDYFVSTWTVHLHLTTQIPLLLLVYLSRH